MRKHERATDLHPSRDRLIRPASYVPFQAERPAPSTRLQEPPGSNRRSPAEYAKDADALIKDYGELMERIANKLLGTGQIVLHTTRGDIWARIVLSRDGGFFEYRANSPSGEGHALARIERAQLAHLLPVLVRHLAGAVLDLGNGARPLD